MKTRTKMKLFCLWLVVLGLLWVGLGVWMPPVPYIGIGVGLLSAVSTLTTVHGWRLVQKYQAGFIRCPKCSGYLRKLPLIMAAKCDRCGLAYGIEYFERKEVDSDGKGNDRRQ